MVLVSRLVGRMAGMRPYLASAPAAPHDPVPGRLRVVGAGGGRIAVPGLTLAGDWGATPFPSALMERAAAIRISAVNTILAARRPGTEPVWSVPPRGIRARQRAAAMRRRPAQPAGAR